MVAPRPRLQRGRVGGSALVFAAVQSLSLPKLFALFFAVLVSASELGHRLGLRVARGGTPAKEAGTIAAATFGLLALLIAFTYSMAVMRYDMRRAVVLDEANALRDAARLAPLLPDDDGPAIVNDLRRVRDIALGLGVPYDSARFDADVAETAVVSGRMWGHLGAAVAAQPGSLPATRMGEALVKLDDAVERRTTALRNHVPMTVYGLLAGTAAVAMAFAGHAAGSAEANRRASAAVMAVLLSAVIAVTLDLQRPDRGSVDIPLTPLFDVAGVLPPLP